MVQNKIIHVDVAFLSYDPKRCSDTPSVKQDNACVIELWALRKHREIKRREKESMGYDAYHHYKWYNSMLCHELKSNPENSKLKVIHWHIESGNIDAFKMNGKVYKSVSIIIGEQMEHWYCANTGKDGSRSYGSRYKKIETKAEKNNLKKLAIFTIDDDEATFVARDEGQIKCTPDICVNNCIECKKFKSPFSISNKGMTCACFPSKEDFKKIESDFEEDLSDEDDDIAASVPPSKSTYLNNHNFQKGKFMLSAICEE